ncbi:peptide ABC transporter substrate-binding protein [Vagococcus fluvialis]|uniref:Peptide ABC transporter substrate-binding protein n=1 Tax=Vagococcus fluvialis TaxID=2738 RepID=A0A369AS33_9ENTE|nr:peptide ABC transporter substrate-binding protein [Vagococcus fluvialis]RCX12159.1 oligopeptide transport system substrate-binding protein [Vagococcus fluvialis]RSU00334.1 peptide ABC transporter substrate-binding protein [Vagococcus fluvialis]UDM70543.1 peptide ABC transporter substrate-binding protein [Vagococcus fluvialis]UDM77961.1 peptide ABC transporter substrate-binding protein [Vagococcus fluvialis]UDM82230.1 peptide ABC transporter substrate-binding protein [Vagococcus fluvialis]
MKKNILLGSIVVLSLILGACGNNGGKTSETTKKETKEAISQSIVISTPAPISTLDTTQTTDKNTFTMVQHLFEGLTRFDETTTPVPGIAKTIDVSEDGKEYNFTLREDAKWSNGETITAHDFEYAWKRLLSPDTQGPNAYLLDNVVNGLAVRNGEKPVDEVGFKATSDTEFKVTLENPQPSFLSVLAIGWLAPQQQAYVEKTGAAYGTNSDSLLYNGAFVLTNWDGTSDTWTLEKNKEYYDQEAVKLEEVSVQTLKEENTGISLFEGGDLDLVRISGQNVAQYSNLDGYVTFNDVANSFLDFNKKEGSPLANLDLRKAIALAIDKEALTESVLADGSKPLNGLVPAGLDSNPETNEDYRKYSGDHVTYNVDEAKKHWKQAQKEVGEKLEVNLLAADTDQGKKVSEYIQSQLEENLPGLKINVNLQPSNNVNQSRREKNYEISLSGWIAGSSEIDSYFNLYVTNSSYNYGNYNNKEYTDLVVKAKTVDANDSNKQFEDYKKAEEILLEQDSAHVPVYQSASNYLVNPKIKNVEYPSYGGYFFLRNAELTE